MTNKPEQMTMKTMYFNSTATTPGYPGYPERSGQRVAVVRRLTNPDEREVGPMFRVRFSDGVEADAFQDELSDI